jgi:hypothetical protein
MSLLRRFCVHEDLLIFSTYICGICSKTKWKEYQFNRSSETMRHITQCSQKQNAGNSSDIQTHEVLKQLNEKQATLTILFNRRTMNKVPRDFQA